MVESYCFTKSCDCKIAYFSVRRKDEPELQLANFSYGFGTKKHYIKRFYVKSCKDELDEVMGLPYNMFMPQTQYTSRLLEFFKEELITNVDFLEHIKRHYKMVKDEVDGPKETVINECQIGRNEICNCGSGKKYKKCCMNK